MSTTKNRLSGESHDQAGGARKPAADTRKKDTKANATRRSVTFPHSLHSEIEQFGVNTTRGFQDCVEYLLKHAIADLKKRGEFGPGSPGVPRHSDN